VALLLWVAGGVLGSSGPLAAENAASDSNQKSALRIDVINSRAEEIAASTSLDEPMRKQLAELYRKAVGSLEAAASYRKLAENYEASIQSAAEEAGKIRDEVARRAQESSDGIPDLSRLALPELELRLLEEKAKLTSANAKLDELKSDIAKEEDRPALVNQRLSAVNNELGIAADEGRAQPPAEQPPELTEARVWTNAAKLEERRAEALKLGQELASHPMRLALLKARRDLAALERDALGERVENIESIVNRVRLAKTGEAKIAAQVAELEASSKHPVVSGLASRNVQLGKDIEALVVATDEINREHRQVTETLQRLEESFAATRKKIEVASVSEVLGRLLQEQRRSLPDAGKLRRMARSREHKMAEVSLAQILLEEERDGLVDVSGYVTQLIAELPDDTRAGLVDELAGLAASRRDLIDQGLEVQRRYLRAMGELDIAEQRLVVVVDRFDTFLAERLLWVRSSQVAGLETMHLIPGQLAEIVSGDNWRGVLSAMLGEPAALGWAAFAVLVAAVLWMRRARLWEALLETNKNVGKLLRDRLADTMRAFVIVALLALPWPLVMLALGWVIFDADGSGAFGIAVGQTLMSLAPVLFQLEALRVFVAPSSIAAIHFGWREQGLQRLHHDLRWFTPLLIAAGAVTVLSFSTTTQHWGSGLARGAFVLTMGLVAVFFYRLSRPNGGTLSLLFAQQQDGRPFRLRHLWFVLLFAPPLIAIVAALAGYTYTAGALIDNIINTAWFILLVIIVHQLVIRWLVLNQRKIRLQAARERRRAELEARAAEERPEETDGVLLREIEEPEIDLNALDTASRKLTNNALMLVALVGIWAIWEDMLPALRVLDEVTLWSYSKAGVEAPIPITLSSVGLALLIFVIMLLATRQLPAFLGIVLLQRLEMSQGTRYTVVTLTKYTVVAVGVAWIFSVLGGSWSEIQWIFAALGVGIGFGLQEIVANFISGLIILFERPIRVGDVVTVGNTDGVVTKIRIRATTIRNWDRKELLVPNKNFITQELLNWSLSDQTTRILINVGIAYGSNVERALLIMEEAARENPRVLEDPAPFVVFETFGDNALMLSLRCYIDNIDFRLRTITELNLAINQAMNEAGIEIAFPQRDVHLDTRRPLEIHLQRPSPKAE
jgi:potassium efflux system protein